LPRLKCMVTFKGHARWCAALHKAQWLAWKTQWARPDVPWRVLRVLLSTKLVSSPHSVSLSSFNSAIPLSFLSLIFALTSSFNRHNSVSLTDLLVSRFRIICRRTCSLWSISSSVRHSLSLSVKGLRVQRRRCRLAPLVALVRLFKSPWQKRRLPVRWATFKRVVRSLHSSKLRNSLGLIAQPEWPLISPVLGTCPRSILCCWRAGACGSGSFY
jgi:hypothetical protein